MAKRQQWILGTTVIWLHRTPLCLNETILNVAPHHHHRYRPFDPSSSQYILFLALSLPFSFSLSFALFFIAMVFASIVIASHFQAVCIDQYAI